MRISTIYVADFLWSECMLKIHPEVIKREEKVDHVDTVSWVTT